MTTTIVLNGKAQLILKPENEMEALLLKELSKGPVELVTRDKVMVVDESFNNAVVLKNT